MKRLLLCGLATLAGAAPLAAQSAADVQERIEATRAAVEAYVQIRQDISRLTHEWAAEKDLIERRIALYEREQTQLETQIAETRQETTGAERQIREVSDQIAELRAATNIISEALPTLEDRVRNLSTLFPAPLAARTNQFIGRLGTSRRAADRMALVIGILNEVDKFNNEFSVDQQRKTLADGTEIFVDVLYVGLAGAYWASEDGAIGGTLTPASGGWVSTEVPEHAADFRTVIDHFQGNIVPAAFVGLPVNISAN